MVSERLSYPSVGKRIIKGKSSEKDQLRYYISFMLDGKRHRLFNASKIGSAFNPNSFPKKHREAQSLILAGMVYTFLRENEFKFVTEAKVEELNLSGNLPSWLREIEVLKLSSGTFSKKYIADLKEVFLNLQMLLKKYKELNTHSLENFYREKYKSDGYYNSKLNNYKAVLNFMRDQGFPVCEFKLKRRKNGQTTVHQNIANVKELLDQIKKHHSKLHLCCTLMYGCLLRPHQEVRQIRWDFFNDDLTKLTLPGSIIKNKKNRIVPVPMYVREAIMEYTGGKIPSEKVNIFSNQLEPYNDDYFSTIWSRLKKEKKLILEDGVTIYSFRHTAAVNIFEKTKDIMLLKKLMDHSNISTTQGYLKNLNILQIEEDDMPSLD